MRQRVNGMSKYICTLPHLHMLHYIYKQYQCVKALNAMLV